MKFNSPESSEFCKMEYAEIGTNLRHLNDIRARTYQYAATMSGVLLIGLTAILNIKVDFNLGLGIFLSLISLLGSLVSVNAYFIEIRSVKHFSILIERGVALEKLYGVKGQVTLSNENLNMDGRSKISFYMKILYAGSIIFWLIAPLAVFLTKS